MANRNDFAYYILSFTRVQLIGVSVHRAVWPRTSICVGNEWRDQSSNSSHRRQIYQFLPHRSCDVTLSATGKEALSDLAIGPAYDQCAWRAERALRCFGASALTRKGPLWACRPGSPSWALVKDRIAGAICICSTLFVNKCDLTIFYVSFVPKRPVYRVIEWRSFHVSIVHFVIILVCSRR